MLRQAMQESASIPRKTGADSGYSYESLRAEGIRLAQELSGRLWTDYNLHDPGVTILEQLCYALTDLVYRTEFDIADYLTGESGGIDFEHLALYHPETIFPTRPVTINDYRRLIFDAVPEIDNVWLHTVTNGDAEGLYIVHAQLAQWVEEHQVLDVNNRVIDRIRRIYEEHRNICEDLADVRLVSHRYYTLHGTIEVDTQPEPEEILGEVYFRSSQLVSASLGSHSYAQVVAMGLSLEEIFTGPLTGHVYIAEEDLEETRESVSISDMVGLIGSIPGVRYVERIWFEDDQGNRLDSIPYDASLETSPRLRLPAAAGEMGVVLRRGGRDYQVPFTGVEHAIGRRFAEYRSRRQARQDFEGVYSLPRGQFREFRSYYSVQHDFPGVYGINQSGLPDSASPRRKSQARNLKAYLLFFEQVMANFLEHLQELPRLFSLDRDLQQTYFYQELNNENSPDVEELYRDGLDRVAGQLAAILRKHDNSGDRRNRILDYLLGLYGETFNAEALSRFDFYGETPLEDAMVQSKIDLLEIVGER